MMLNTDKLSLQRGITLLLVVSAVLLAASYGFAQAQNSAQPSTLTAVGNGEVRVRPDLAVVRLGMQTEAKTAGQAREQNAAIVTKVINALKALGIPERQIETSSFQIYPIRRFEDDQKPQGEPPIVGYSVVNIISTRTEDLNLVPRIIDTAVGAGANTVESVDFRLKDDRSARQNALKQAVDDAAANAKTMAEALKVRMVKVYQVQQGGVGVVPPPYPVRSMALDAGAPTPIFPGEVTVSASITLTYLIQ